MLAAIRTLKIIEAERRPATPEERRLLARFPGFGAVALSGMLADLARALPRIHARWAKLNPAPTRAIPVLVGGGGERKTLRYTAEHATIWHGFGDAATIARKSGILDGHCADIGRDPAEIERSSGVQAPPDRVAGPLLDAGVSLFTVGIGGPDYDLGLLRRWIRWRDEQQG